MRALIALAVIVAAAILVFPKLFEEFTASRDWVVLTTKHRGVEGGQGSGMTPIWCQKADGSAQSHYTVWIPLADKPDYQPGNSCPVPPEEAERDRWDTAPLPPLVVLYVDGRRVACGYAKTLVKHVYTRPLALRARVGDRCPE